jgi:hypothetical protein
MPSSHLQPTGCFRRGTQPALARGIGQCWQDTLVSQHSPCSFLGGRHPALATDMERCAVTSLSPGTDLVQQQSILQLQLPHHQLCHLLIEAVEAAMLCAKYRRSAPLAKSALALEERGASDWAQSTSATPS